MEEEAEHNIPVSYQNLYGLPISLLPNILVPPISSFYSCLGWVGEVLSTFYFHTTGIRGIKNESITLNNNLEFAKQPVIAQNLSFTRVF